MTDATVLYPSSSDAAPPADPVQNASPRPSTGAELARALYPPKNTYAALRAPLQGLADEVGSGAEDLAATHEAVANTFADLEVPVPEAREWLDLLMKHDTAPADAQQVAAWNREVRGVLREKYGADADSRLAAAQKLIAQHPDFRAHLSETGLGSHPRIVLSLVERAPQLLGRG